MPIGVSWLFEKRYSPLPDASATATPNGNAPTNKLKILT